MRLRLTLLIIACLLGACGSQRSLESASINDPSVDEAEAAAPSPNSAPPKRLPLEAQVGMLTESRRGEPFALCGPGEEQNIYGSGETDPSASSGQATAEQVADEFLESVRRDVSPDNPGLAQLPAEARQAYLDRFEKYYGPAKDLRVSESRVEGSLTIFVEPMDQVDGSSETFDAFTWASVRVEVKRNQHGLFELSSAVICGRQLYDAAALTDPIDFDSLPNRVETWESETGSPTSIAETTTPPANDDPRIESISAEDRASLRSALAAQGLPDVFMLGHLELDELGANFCDIAASSETQDDFFDSLVTSDLVEGDEEARIQAGAALVVAYCREHVSRLGFDGTTAS